MDSPEKQPDAYQSHLEGLERHASKSPTEDERAMLDALKSDLNAFLWTRLPGRITLDRAEEISCDIWSRIRAEWEGSENG